MYLAIRLALRELRGGLAGFRIFLACLAVGVFAIAAVGSVRDSMNAALDRDSRDLLGGDVEFRVAQRELAGPIVDWLRTNGRVSEVHLLRAMLRTADDSARSAVELKAVDDVYPLSGRVTLEPNQALDAALAVRGGVPGVAIDPILQERLHVGVGSKLMLGDTSVEVRAILASQPDKGANAFGLGPPVLIGMDGYRATGLDKPGTLNSVAYRILLPMGMEPASFIKDAEQRYPDAGWLPRDRAHALQGIERFLDRTALFLSLIGLTALLIGGVGIANAVTFYLQGKETTIATLKCLGAPGGLVFAIYLVQIAILGFVGTFIGVLGGAAVPWLVQRWAGDWLPVPLVLRLFPKPLAIATAFGLLSAVGFSLLPLFHTRAVLPAALFRGGGGRVAAGLRPRDWGILLGFGAVGVALALSTAADPKLAAWFIVGTGLSLLAFRILAWLAVISARKLGPARPAWLRLAIANLHRPGSAAVPVVLSLGLGLSVLVAVALVEQALSDELDGRIARQAPSFFFIDIQPDDVAGFKSLVAAVPGTSELHMEPSLRARLSRVNGVPAAQARIDPDQRNLAQSDRGLSYTSDLPAGSTVTAGQWWVPDYQGPPLVSLDQSWAKGLHVGVGDTVSFDVAGREITGRVANLRRIDWLALGINFFTVFSPGVLEPAPQTDIATVRCTDTACEEALSRAVADRLPNISAIRVKDGIDTVNRVLAGLAAAIRGAAIVCLISGALVLAGAVTAGHRRRLKDAVILKVLGATRWIVARGLIVEFGLLGLATALPAALIGAVVASLLLTELMDMAPASGWSGVVWIVLAGTAGTMLVAVGSTWGVLSVRTAPQLRNEQ